MVEQLSPVVGVGGGAEDVHHHEVLDVVMLPSRLLQLVNIVPVITCSEDDNLNLQHTLSHLQILSIFLIMGMFTSRSCSLLGLTLEVERGLSPAEVISLGPLTLLMCLLCTLYHTYLLVSDMTEFFIMQDIVMIWKIGF